MRGSGIGHLRELQDGRRTEGYERKLLFFKNHIFIDATDKIAFSGEQKCRTFLGKSTALIQLLQF
jgi:hypothetical protein